MQQAHRPNTEPADHSHEHVDRPPTDGTEYGSPGHRHHEHHEHHDEHAGHDKHAGHDPEMFRRLFWWNVVLAIPVLIFSKQIQEWFGYSIDGAWAAWPAPVIGTVIFVWGGQPFLKGGVSEVRDRQPGMMLLIALAITVAYVSSLASSLGSGGLAVELYLGTQYVGSTLLVQGMSEGASASTGNAFTLSDAKTLRVLAPLQQTPFQQK